MYGRERLKGGPPVARIFVSIASLSAFTFPSASSLTEARASPHHAVEARGRAVRRFVDGFGVLGLVGRGLLPAPLVHPVDRTRIPNPMCASTPATVHPAGIGRSILVAQPPDERAQALTLGVGLNVVASIHGTARRLGDPVPRASRLSSAHERIGVEGFRHDVADADAREGLFGTVGKSVRNRTGNRRRTCCLGQVEYVRFR